MQRLRELREQAHLTQAALADLATKMLPELPSFRISQQYINDLETGRNRNPNWLAVQRISAALDCAPDDLYLRTQSTEAATAAA